MTPPDAQLDLPAQSAPDPMAAVQALESQTRHLWMLFQTSVVAVIIFTLGVNAYIYKQTRILRVQLDQEKVAVAKLASDFQKAQDPLWRNFAAKIQNFAYKNPDFLPILDKYRTPLNGYFTPMPALPSTALSPAGAKPQQPSK